MRSQIIVFGIVAMLASCYVPAVTFSVGDAQSPSQDCNAVGDDAGNVVDCTNPACADTPACKPKSLCGDGKVEADEQCDEGGADTQKCNGNDNGSNGPGSCQFPACGDGYVNKATGEQCDTLGGGDSATCNGKSAGSASCHLSVCGDGYLNVVAGENCDDFGLTTATCNGPNAGSASCHFPVCGDGYLNVVAGEDCDDFGFDTAECNGKAAGSASCKFAVCGDGYVNVAAGEQCDDGVNNSDTRPDACRTNCSRPFCGDGVIDTAEACDRGAGCPANKMCNASCSACI